jgi:hypothetical protein
VTRAEPYYGGRCSTAGYTPASERSLYAYLYEPVQDRRSLSPAEQLAVVGDLASTYRGPWEAIREAMTDPARIHYAVLESHLLAAPWNRGRIVIIGDAAHTFPPTLAQRAAMALEDAAVLAELLLDNEKLDDELWAAFTERRQDRVRAIVDWSLQLCRWQLNRGARRRTGPDGPRDPARQPASVKVPPGNRSERGSAPLVIAWRSCAHGRPARPRIPSTASTSSGCNGAVRTCTWRPQPPPLRRTHVTCTSRSAWVSGCRGAGPSTPRAGRPPRA